ncbi:MAG: hypothetical protein KM296_03385, partial [Brockia lithotrophica]|nr:hypothetical protein [Brockia lithotrophica]
ARAAERYNWVRKGAEREMETSVDRYTEAVRALSRTYAGPARAEMLLRYLDEHLGGADWPDRFPEFLAGLGDLLIFSLGLYASSPRNLRSSRTTRSAA